MARRTFKYYRSRISSKLKDNIEMMKVIDESMKDATLDQWKGLYEYYCEKYPEIKFGDMLSIGLTLITRLADESKRRMSGLPFDESWNY